MMMPDPICDYVDPRDALLATANKIMEDQNHEIARLFCENRALDLNVQLLIGFIKELRNRPTVISFGDDQ